VRGTAVMMTFDDFDARLAQLAEEMELAEVQHLVKRATWIDLRAAEWCWEGPTNLDFPVRRFETVAGAVPSAEMPGGQP